MQHIGIDLGGTESQVCVRTPEGDITLERKVITHRLAGFLKRQPHSRVILETCSEAFRIADAAIDHGHDVRVVPATLVRTLGVGHRGIKTDKRDAEVLSEVSTRINLPSVHIRSEGSRNLKTLLGMKSALVDSRTKLICCVRGWMRTQLIKIRSGTPETFPKRVEKRLLEEPTGVPAYVTRQLRVIHELNEQIREAEKEVAAVAKNNEVCRRLMTVPGVGPVTAITFLAALDDVSRFPHAHRVESYLGLTPGERSSSKKKCRTAITKAGAPEVRWALGQSAWKVWRCRPHDPLAVWGRQVAERRGKHVAVTAMARKLAGLLYAMWRDGTTYNPTKVSKLAAEEALASPA